MNDRAGLLPEGRARALEAKLARFEAETTHQIVVLTIPSTGGEPIADFSVRVFEAWRPGHAGLDNGVLLVVAPEDREAWIATGYGLEGTIPDAVAARIVRERMIPHFREGRMPDGIEAGTEALMQAARGEVVAPERRPRRARPSGQRAPGDRFHVTLFCSFLGSFFGSPLRRRARIVGGIVGGLVAGGLCYLLVGSLALAVLAFFLGSALGLLGPGLGGGGRVGRGYGRWGGGGFGGGGFGGGFGGGGGLTGGGGAGGRW